MDIITSAILAAVAAGASRLDITAKDDTNKSASKAIAGAYLDLKTLLKQKFGWKSELAKAIEAVEAQPDSAGRRATLQQEVAAAKADQDAEVLVAAHMLLAMTRA